MDFTTGHFIGIFTSDGDGAVTVAGGWRLCVIEYIYIRTYMNIYIYKYLCVCVYMWTMSACGGILVHIWIYIYVHIWIYMYINIYVCVCMCGRCLSVVGFLCICDIKRHDSSHVTWAHNETWADVMSKRDVHMGHKDMTHVTKKRHASSHIT